MAEKLNVLVLESERGAADVACAPRCRDQGARRVRSAASAVRAT
jgi:hypothetical protein